MALKSMLVQEEFDAALGNVLDASGNPSALDASVPPVWSADSALVDIVPAADGMSAIVKSTSELGAWTVTVVADGRAGDDRFEITGVLSGITTVPDAATFEITAGESRPRTV